MQYRLCMYINVYYRWNEFSGMCHLYFEGSCSVEVTQHPRMVKSVGGWHSGS